MFRCCLLQVANKMPETEAAGNLSGSPQQKPADSVEPRSAVGYKGKANDPSHVSNSCQLKMLSCLQRHQQQILLILQIPNEYLFMVGAGEAFVRMTMVAMEDPIPACICSVLSVCSLSSRDDGLHTFPAAHLQNIINSCANRKSETRKDWMVFSSPRSSC